MNDEHVVARLADGVLRLTLDRPKRKNALTADMYDALRMHLSEAIENPEVRAVLICGGPDYFCAGTDIDGLAAVRELPIAERPGYRLMQVLTTFPKPVVAAVSGDAIGIGTTLLLHCDLVYARDDARLCTPFVDLGLVPEFGSSLLLPGMAGHARAAVVLMLGEAISAQHACAIGIVSKVLAAEDVLPTAEAAARSLASKPAAALQRTKRLMKHPMQDTLLQTMEREMVAFNEQLHTPETREILSRVLNRKPN